MVAPLSSPTTFDTKAHTSRNSYFTGGNYTTTNITTTANTATKQSFSLDPPSKFAGLSRDSFVIMRVLGTGSFGTVYHVRLRDTREEYALK